MDLLLPLIIRISILYTSCHQKSLNAHSRLPRPFHITNDEMRDIACCSCWQCGMDPRNKQLQLSGCQRLLTTSLSVTTTARYFPIHIIRCRTCTVNLLVFPERAVYDSSCDSLYHTHHRTAFHPTTATRICFSSISSTYINTGSFR